MSRTVSGKENNQFFRLTWERFFVSFNVIIYVSSLVLILTPSIKAQTALLFFFGSSMGLYIVLLFSAVVVNTFAMPAQHMKPRQRKTVTGLI